MRCRRKPVAASMRSPPRSPNTSPAPPPDRVSSDSGDAPAAHVGRLSARPGGKDLDRRTDEAGKSIGVQNNRRHVIASAHSMCPLEAKLGSQRLFPRAPRTTLNGFAPGIQIVAKMRPRSRPVRACPGTDAPDSPFTIDAMPLEIHTQPDPD